MSSLTRKRGLPGSSEVMNSFTPCNLRLLVFGNRSILSFLLSAKIRVIRGSKFGRQISSQPAPSLLKVGQRDIGR